jgi:gem associated protein 2
MVFKEISDYNSDYYCLAVWYVYRSLFEGRLGAESIDSVTDLTGLIECVEIRLAGVETTGQIIPASSTNYQNGEDVGNEPYQLRTRRGLAEIGRVFLSSMSEPCLPVVSRPKKRAWNGDADYVSKEIDTAGKLQEDPSEEEGFEDIETIDASEYLSRVVSQAKKLPEFFVARSHADDGDDGMTSNVAKRDDIPANHRHFVPIDGSAASLSYLLSGRASLTRPPTVEYLPQSPKEWTETTLSNFERLRIYLESCRENGVGGKLTERVAFPPMKDRAGWHLFCVGEEEATGNTDSYFGDDYDKPTNFKSRQNQNGPSDGETTVPEWRREIPAEGHPASVKVISQMDQVLVRQILTHLCHYVGQGWKLTAQRTLWIYALLARLEKPVHRDEASTLFGLLKVLTMARSKLNLSVEGRVELSRLNLLIVLVGVYFEQGASIAMSVLDV